MMRKNIRITSTVIIIIASLYIIYALYDEYKAIRLSDTLAQTYTQLTSAETIDAVPDTTIVPEKDIYYTIISDGTTASEGSQNEITQKPMQTDISDEKSAIDYQPVISQAMMTFYEQNPDTAGWLTINNTKINNIVVQTTDNDFYLNHNFEGDKSQPGTLFVDYRCNLNDYNYEQSKNIIIYGHKQRSGSMFGTLHNYHDNLEFYKQNPTFEFSNLYETYTYKVLAMFVCRTTGDDVFDYHNYVSLPETGDYCFYKWLLNVRDRSEIETPVSAEINDHYLTLSTCSYEEPDCRFVVIARRVRPDESSEVSVEDAYSRCVTIR